MEPPNIATLNIVFSGIRHFLFRALCLSIKHKKKPEIFARESHISKIVRGMLNHLSSDIIKLYCLRYRSVNDVVPKGCDFKFCTI